MNRGESAVVDGLPIRGDVLCVAVVVQVTNFRAVSARLFAESIDRFFDHCDALRPTKATKCSGRGEVGFGDTHHSVTHHLGDAAKIAKVITVNTFHTTMLSYYLERLEATPDGDGSLLDHSMVLYGSSLSDGNQHLYRDLPVLLVGGGVAGIKGGMHVRYPTETPMANLFLTMLDKAGVPHVESMGDSTGRLELPTI